MVEFERPTTPNRESVLAMEIERTPIYIGAGITVLLSITALLVPLFALIGGGIVGGFVAAYLVSGPIRGLVHGAAAGLVAGFGHGVVTTLLGGILGLYMEPPTFVGWLTGPVAPDFAFMGLATPFLILTTIALMVAADATIGAIGGVALRSVRDEIAD